MPPELTARSVLVAPKGSVIVADALVIAVTWRELFLIAPRRKGFIMRRHVALADVFLRDGNYLILFGIWDTS